MLLVPGLGDVLPDRRCIDVARGSPWADMPERYGPYRTAYDRFCRWRDDGTWARLKAAVIALAEAEQDIGWNAQADSTIVRAHQHAAGVRKGGWMPALAWPGDPIRL
jgi:transposase